jgi:hypothetical protein
MTKKLQSFITEINAAFDARAEYENAKNAENTNIQRTLADLRASCSHEAIAKLMLAANIDAAFINRAERSNARFNVYSAEKIVNVFRFAASAASLNHYTLNILKSIIACNAASIDFTQRDAVACCTLEAKLDATKAALLSQYQKHVAMNTASTQASSSLNALLACSVIVEKRNAANVSCFALAESELAETLRAKI